MHYDVLQRPQCLVAKRNHASPVNLSQCLRNDYLREKSNIQLGEQNERRFVNYLPRDNRKDVSIVDLVGKDVVLNDSYGIENKHIRSIDQLRLPLIQSLVFKTIEDRRSLPAQSRCTNIKTLKYKAEDVLPNYQCSSYTIHSRMVPHSKQKGKLRYRDRRNSSLHNSANSNKQDDQKTIEDELQLIKHQPPSELSVKPPEIEPQVAEILRLAECRRKRRKRQKPSPSPPPSLQVAPGELQPWETVDYESDFEAPE